MDKIDLDLKDRAERLGIPLELIKTNASRMGISVDRYLRMLEGLMNYRERREKDK